mmetsp:Transcript_35587/g.100030  ORF Transcript_35587/g.100030 Transcript_35587/m.100030 type:complete len:326 (+) Transcript_35587:236-1213(+)
MKNSLRGPCPSPPSTRLPRTTLVPAEHSKYGDTTQACSSGSWLPASASAASRLRTMAAGGTPSGMSTMLASAAFAPQPRSARCSSSRGRPVSSTNSDHCRLFAAELPSCARKAWRNRSTILSNTGTTHAPGFSFCPPLPAVAAWSTAEAATETAHWWASSNRSASLQRSARTLNSATSGASLLSPTSSSATTMFASRTCAMARCRSSTRPARDFAVALSSHSPRAACPCEGCTPERASTASSSFGALKPFAWPAPWKTGASLALASANGPPVPPSGPSRWARPWLLLSLPCLKHPPPMIDGGRWIVDGGWWRRRLSLAPPRRPLP